MKWKCRSLVLLAMCMVCALATSGAAAGSASAATACLKTTNTKEAVFKERSTTGVCEGTAGTTGGWVKVEEQDMEPLETRGNTHGVERVYCVKAAESKESSWEKQCTKEKAGGGFVKVTSACLLSYAVTGQGSSLQKVAQQKVWVPESNCNATYKSSGSGAGRKAWGAEEAASATKPSNSGDTFIGSDEPLSVAQMEHLDEAAKGKYSSEDVNKEGQTLVIPVEQAAVAVIVNPPKECTITQITNKHLLEVWDGTLTEWSSIGSGAGCAGKKITRIVRKDVSGTTFVFKTYLEEIAKGAATCNGDTWKVLAEPADNKKWPISTQTGCAGISELFEAKNEGGSGEAEEVLKEEQGKKEGDIGYANLADARAQYNGEMGNHYHWIKVETEHVEGEGAKFENPGAGTTEPSTTAGESNCEKTDYTNRPTRVGEDDNWEKVNGAHPVGNAHYPICTLTYDIALLDYEKAEYLEEPNKRSGLATEEYLTYAVAPEGGQKALAKHDYREVEEAVGKYAQEEARLVAGVKVKASSEELKFTAAGEKKSVEYTNEGMLPWVPDAPYISGTNALNYAVVSGSNTCTGPIAVSGKCKVEVEYISGTHGSATLLLRQAPPVKLN